MTNNKKNFLGKFKQQVGNKVADIMQRGGVALDKAGEAKELLMLLNMEKEGLVGGFDREKKSINGSK